MITSPPLPPSPPEGPPRGTNFSRRKAMQPLPPSPAFTRILASSTNIGRSNQQLGTSLAVRQNLACLLVSAEDANQHGCSSESAAPLCPKKATDFISVALKK